MTEDNSVNNDLKDAGKVVEDQKDPDKLLRGLSSEGQEEGNGVDPDQEFHDLGQLAVQSGKNGRNENGGNGGDNGRGGTPLRVKVVRINATLWRTNIPIGRKETYMKLLYYQVNRRF